MQPGASVESFSRWQEELVARLDPEAKVVTVCGGTGCGAFGAEGIRESFQQEIDRRGLQGQVSVKTTGCHGFCEKGPVVVTLPEQVFCPSMRPEDVPEC
jgi:NADH:ubiquinone oxidoreductase subunit E